MEDTATANVPAASPLEILLGEVGFGDFVSMDITQAQELQNEGVEPGDIREVHLSSFVLSATSPEDADLSFLESMAIFVEADGLPRARIASAEDFSAATVSFDLDDVELSPYVLSEAMTLTTEVTGQRPSAETTVSATYTLDVGVTSQGACKAVRGGGP